MLKNVRHTGIVVQNLEASRSFYTALGFEVVSSDVEEGAFIESVTGLRNVKLEWIKMRSSCGFLLELLKYHSHDLAPSEIPANVNKHGCSHIAFTVENASMFLEKVCQLGGYMINPPAINPTGQVKVAYCHDPEGVLLEIVEELV
ncbi:VOC family protein [Aestuariibacter sp. AA17]|uniref:VOC family protein n=1 Tax=Fluctibacter corallii TaxID=2984329 RepID=A0ABT3A9W4_9ALTE|nr:VOC family protein [Aestuariibacter sp. AA17]MCV2885439.1 VOC family protein [Aestuariibacter sp. AA17]